MSSDWAQFLATRCSTAGPSLDAGARAAAAAGCALSDLPGYALIEVAGADAEAFLHAQLSSDVRALAHHRCQLSTYSSPKGRVLATLLLWRSADGFLLQVPASIAPGLAKRLAMFVLRAKVRIAPAAERWIGLGIAGPRAQQVLADAGLGSPGQDFAITAGNGAAPDAILRLPGERYALLVAGADHAIALWQKLCTAGAAAADEAVWRWHGIVSGIADIVPQTQDQFVAQMLNYDLLGAVSFTKGCYPGQEIVARTQYRGEVKRRTWLLHGAVGELPAAAQPIYGPASDQAAGTILTAAPAPQGGYDTLACMHVELAAAGELRLGTPLGPELQRGVLPYVLPASR